MARATTVLDRRTYYPGQVIFRQGEVPYSAFIIESGAVEIVREHEGDEVLLATLKPGTVFGEMGMLDGKPRSATARVVETAVVKVVNEKMIDQLKEHMEPGVWALMKALMSRLRDANALLEQVSAAAKQVGREKLKAQGIEASSCDEDDRMSL
jgi:CRP-like cAMP-binding protein